MPGQVCTAQTVSLTGTGWTAVGDTAPNCLVNADGAKYLNTAPPSIPGNTGNFVASNFGFTIPAGAINITITYQFTAEKAGAPTQKCYSSLTKDGVTPDSWNGPTTLLTTWAATGFGPASGYTVAQINASTFGVMFNSSLYGLSATMKVDQIYITVTYDLGTTQNWSYSGSVGIEAGVDAAYSFTNWPAVSWLCVGQVGIVAGVNGTYNFTPAEPATIETPQVIRNRQRGGAFCELSGIWFPASRLRVDGEGRLVGDLFYRGPSPIEDFDT